MQNFRALGAPPPDPIGLRRLEAPPPDPKISLPPLRISGYAPASIFGEDLFFGLHLNSGKKSGSFLVIFFFALHLICSPEKNRGRGSSPSMLKIGKKLQIILPNAQQRFAPLVVIIAVKIFIFKLV